MADEPLIVMAENWIQKIIDRTWTPMKGDPGTREEFFDVRIMVTCRVCDGVCGTHRLGCRRCVEEVAARMLGAEEFMRTLGIDQTPEQQCLELAKAYKGEAAAHWDAVAERITFLRENK